MGLRSILMIWWNILSQAGRYEVNHIFWIAVDTLGIAYFAFRVRPKRWFDYVGVSCLVVGLLVQVAQLLTKSGALP